jgi:hypothetical protein
LIHQSGPHWESISQASVNAGKIVPREMQGNGGLGVRGALAARMLTNSAGEYAFSSEFDRLEGHVRLPGAETGSWLEFDSYYEFPVGVNYLEMTVMVDEIKVLSTSRGFMANRK